ncbi:DUF4489 domain-containing protein [Pseudalkalibacillus sp. SCS-8]|uniref:DUF4489 domain-containing protein n=1 Tax=Pseudalkalibacillus nanhaiensis TaxID=3115291 RepID=UPI0032DBBA11
MNERRSTPKPRLFLGQNKQMSTVVTNQGHQKKSVPFVKCGKVFNPVLPLKLTKKGTPVILTQVTVNTERITEPCILINFSCFVTSILRQQNFVSLIFRLVKSSSDDNKQEVLRTWPFKRELVTDTNIKEPVVFNFCEWLATDNGGTFTYTIELVSVDLSKQTSYNITQKSMTAQVFCGTGKF